MSRTCITERAAYNRGMGAEEILEGLNDEQKAAVAHDQGPLLIVAGAGTGKTTVITRRIAYLIALKRARPEEILALTFTDKAAREMQERVDRLVPYGYANVWVSTFHAFGDRVLRTHAPVLGLPPDLRVLTRPEQVIFLRHHLFELPLRLYRPLGNPTRHLQAILTLISRAKDEDVAPEEYLEYAARLAAQAETSATGPALKEEAEQTLELAQTYAAYQELMAEHHYVDFGDQVTLTLRLFREHPAVLAEYARQYRYILVDEFQDTNYAQFQLTKLLAREHENITVCGDDDQSIYKFRGAAISNILGFVEAFPRTKQVVLVHNYRSPQDLLDTAYRLIRYNDPDRLEVKNRIDKRLHSDIPATTPVTHLHFDSVYSEADRVADLIGEKVTNQTLHYGDIAILVRANSDADPFLRALNMSGIPWRFTGNQGLYSREEIKLLLSFLRVLCDFDDNTNLYHLAASDFYRFPVEDLVRVGSLATRSNRSLYSFFKELPDNQELAVSAEARAAAAQIVKDLVEYGALAQSRPTGEVLYKFLQDKGYLRRLTTARSRPDEECVRNISRFFDIIRATSLLLEYDRVREAVALLDLLIEAGDDPPVAEADLTVDAVNILTIHKAKGLEFPVVFLVSLVEDRFPTRARHDPIPLPEALIKDFLPAGDFHLQEERRLFYVAMTRAQRELILTSAEDYGGKRMRKVSQFVVEALDLPRGIPPPPYRPAALESIERFAPHVSSPEEPYEPLPDAQPLTLSYLQIDDFLTCPLKYKYVHVLRVPVLRHHAVVFGKALHDAVAFYYRQRLAGRSPRLEELQAVFRGAWTSEGFLTRDHEERRLEEGQAALARFHDAEEKQTNLPTEIEKEFSFPVDETRVVGRWDRVDSSGSETRIIDFKSSDVADQKKADDEARKSLQLAIYALAFERLRGAPPAEVGLYFLESGIIGRARKGQRELVRAAETITKAAQGIRKKVYVAAPSSWKCPYCAYSQVCPDAKVA